MPRKRKHGKIDAAVGPGVRTSVHAGWLRLYFFWRHESRERGWVHSLPHFSSACGESEAVTLKVLLGRAGATHYTYNRLVRAARELTEDWWDRGGYEINLCLRPSGVVQPYLEPAGGVELSSGTRDEYQSLLEQVTD